MTTFFVHLVQISIQGAFVALVIMALRLLLTKRPKRYAYALWLIVLLRLCLPMSFETSFSLLPKAVVNSPFLAAMSSEGVPMDAPEVEKPWEVPVKKVDPTSTFGFLEGATLLYGVGVLVLLLHFSLEHGRLRKKMQGAKKIGQGLYMGRSIDMPFSYGVFHKRIYLPLGLTVEEKAQIIAHEKVHLKRQDPLIKMVGYLMVILHWFNPILWLSYTLMIKDMELSCDERTLQEASKEEKSAYAKALLKISQDAPKTLAATAYSLGDVGKRIQNIFSFKKTTWKEKVVFVLIFFLMLALLLTNPLEKITGNVEKVMKELTPTESIFGDHLEHFKEGDQLLIGRKDHKIDETFDKSKPLSMQGLRKEFLDEKNQMMIHESLHFLPGDTIYVEDDVQEVFYDEEADVTYLTFLADDGFHESVGFKGNELSRFGEGTPKRVSFKFQVKGMLPYSDRFQILDYNELYQETGEVPPVEPFLP